MTVCRSWMAGMAVLTTLAFVAPPLAAQSVASPDTTAAPVSNDVVGPRELQNFNLGGSVVRPAPPSAPAPISPRSASAAPAEASPESSSRAAGSAPPSRTARREKPTAAPVERSVPTAKTPVVVPPIAPPSPGSAVSPEAVASPPAPAPASSGGMLLWPGWLALLAAAAGFATFIHFRRQQREKRLAFAGTDVVETLHLAPRQPAPPPAIPKLAVTPAPSAEPVPDGIVSRGLRPDIQLAFTPLSVAIDQGGTAMVVFDLVVHNVGSAPARDVLVEAGMFNAGPRQDIAIGEFFANPLAQGDRIPIIAPMSHVGVRSRVFIPAERLDPVEIEGRRLLVPLVAFNTLYRWSGGETQSSASFLVGRGGADAPKLAPFSLDRGARAWGEVAARSHSSGLAGQTTSLL